jgi:hypothetical protein
MGVVPPVIAALLIQHYRHTYQSVALCPPPPQVVISHNLIPILKLDSYIYTVSYTHWRTCLNLNNNSLLHVCAVRAKATRPLRCVRASADGNGEAVGFKNFFDLRPLAVQECGSRVMTCGSHYVSPLNVCTYMCVWHLTARVLSFRFYYII